MALQRSGELKKRAWLAKQRLKMGYPAAEGSNSGEAAREYARRSQIVEPPRDAGDELMYKKVCAMLDRDETIMNPIGQLIDDEVYGRLDPASRQRYILELSNKFRELKERYYRERMA